MTCTARLSKSVGIASSWPWHTECYVSGADTIATILEVAQRVKDNRVRRRRSPKTWQSFSSVHKEIATLLQQKARTPFGGLVGVKLINSTVCVFGDICSRLDADGLKLGMPRQRS
jgi:hypothetical protein